MGNDEGMNENIIYWVWLVNAIGYNSPKPKKIFEMYDSIKDFYLGKEREWRLSGIFTDKEITALSNSSIDKAQSIFSKSVKLGYSLFTFEDEEYPRCLFNIYAPPAVLYVSGELNDIDNRLTIGIVGARKPKEYGVRHAYNIAYNLSKVGVTIISGGALGVDCAAHRGTLNAGGVTVCVLGCGINTDYLRDNANMRRSITFKGAVISEYPPDTPPLPHNFPARNRIISALSDGVLIVEAGKKSGSLITANYALEQGKELFALMGAADSSYDFGSNQLIKDGCAVPVTEYTDIINQFDNVYVTAETKEYSATNEEIKVIPIKGMNKNHPAEKYDNTQKSKTNNQDKLKTEDKQKNTELPVHRNDIRLSNDEKTVYESIGNEPIHIDELSVKLNIKVYKLLPLVTKLEMKGLIESTQGRCYKLK